MINRFCSVILIVFLITIGSSAIVLGQSTDSLLSMLRQGIVKNDIDKYNLLCRIASNSNEFDTIVKYSEQAIALAEKSNINPVEAFIYQGFGYLNSGMLTLSLESFIAAADYYKTDGNNIGVASVYTYIAEVFNQQENYDRAKFYLKNAAKIFRQERDKIRLADALHNLGYTNYCMGQYDTALVIYSETGDIYQKLGRPISYALCMGNTGLAYYKKSEFDKAEDYLLRAIELLSKQGDERGVTQFTVEYAGVLQQKGEIKKAITTAIKGFDKAERHDILEYERDASLRLSSLYQISGKFDSAFFYQSIYINANDSIKSIRSVQKLAEKNTEFNLAQKQSEVNDLREKKLIQLIIILGLILILVLAIGIILLYYYSLKRSQKLSAALDERRILLEKQSQELKDQREELKHQKEEIISSINYAKYIQSSLLPQEDQMDSLLGEHFVLYKPKDIVSGDFYWISNIENKTVIAAADCTGHGVPGAFMSMLGTALLNEIVNKEYITHPGVILRHLRKEVINSLQQKGERGEQKDGMDIALCTIDKENMKLQFAGANNPLFLIRKSDQEKTGTLRCDLGGEDLLYEIKGDLMPIGISDKMDNFTFHEIDIFKGDTFYLFSDGFPDQFGGPDNRKFGYKRFREQLLRNNSKTLAESKTLLEKVLYEWMDDGSQIDDILVIGFRIG